VALRVDCLPYYGRLLAALNQLWPDIGTQATAIVRQQHTLNACGTLP